jgi:hypothetical protein
MDALTFLKLVTALLIAFVIGVTWGAAGKSNRED